MDRAFPPNNLHVFIYLFDYRYKGCGIDEVRRKEMHVPKYIPNLVDMTGLENVESREQEKLLEMILMGKIPDETSIPALQDMERRNTGSLNRNFPFTYDPRRIHKILFVATATEPIPTKLIQSVRNVAQPDGSPSNYNPRCKRWLFFIFLHISLLVYVNYFLYRRTLWDKLLYYN